MPNAITNANLNGFLFPFKNGVLNVRTKDFNSHSQDFYTTHIIPVEYSAKDSIKNTKFSDFLTTIVNNNLNRLKILRICLYLILTNNLIYQLALYIYGPGGTGKSTFINILMYLLGKEVTLSSSISQITSKFGLASLVGKILLVLNDVSLYRGQEPKDIKNIVTGDVMEAEMKYKQPFMFTPSSFLIMSSNILWDIKNTTTGLSRRMIYFPFDNIPDLKELDLFKILPNGEAIGSLVPHLSGFVNWILTCPKDNLNLLLEGGSKITELISQDSIHVNPLHVFVKECLEKDENSRIRLGSLDPKEESLYRTNRSWAQINGVNPLNIKSFSILILDLLNQQGWNVIKKRVAIGFVITGVTVSVNWLKDTYYQQKPEYIDKALDKIETIENSISILITEDDFNNS
jgi:putative DNA primase/helicase